jgi:hypothetical protein
MLSGRQIVCVCVCSDLRVLIITSVVAMVPKRQHDVAIHVYQSSFGPPDPVLGCAVSKEPYTFVPFFDTCDLGSDHPELLMEAYFISLAFTMLKANWFSHMSHGAVIAYTLYTGSKILTPITIPSCVLSPFLESKCKNALFYL